MAQAVKTPQEQGRTPMYAFDAKLSKLTDDNKNFVAWQFSMDRASFPASQLPNGETRSFTLDRTTYATSFNNFTQLFGTSLPDALFAYTVTAENDRFYVKGMTEATVRAAVVDLVALSNADTKVMMLARPPVTFRVYEEEQEFSGITCIFGPEDGGDY